jgi:hypothetical protein
VWLGGEVRGAGPEFIGSRITNSLGVQLLAVRSPEPLASLPEFGQFVSDPINRAISTAHHRIMLGHSQMLDEIWVFSANTAITELVHA